MELRGDEREKESEWREQTEKGKGGWGCLHAGTPKDLGLGGESDVETVDEAGERGKRVLAGPLCQKSGRTLAITWEETTQRACITSDR